MPPTPERCSKLAVASINAVIPGALAQTCLIITSSYGRLVATKTTWVELFLPLTNKVGIKSLHVTSQRCPFPKGTRKVLTLSPSPDPKHGVKKTGGRAPCPKWHYVELIVANGPHYKYNYNSRPHLMNAQPCHLIIHTNVYVNSVETV